MDHQSLSVILVREIDAGHIDKTEMGGAIRLCVLRGDVHRRYLYVCLLLVFAYARVLVCSC